MREVAEQEKDSHEVVGKIGTEENKNRCEIMLNNVNNVIY